MGKPKKVKGSTDTPKCTCDHPFNCDCGNRPPRPSKGHKWDSVSQSWGGKGHKQKGASGQVAAVNQHAIKTSAQTTVATWQRLPTQLLDEVCRRQKRHTPKYVNVENKTGLYKYRAIIPDAKDSKKSLFFLPAQAVANEEQAKEESALLALLSLTPNLPHERKLPEPYKTTWIHTIATANKQERLLCKEAKADGVEVANAASTGGQIALASKNLTSATLYTSVAEKQRQAEKRRQQRNARIQHHEAVRMANQNHPVFMSANIRNEIECLLKGETFSLDDDDDDGAINLDSNQDLDEAQVYVEQRLCGEGFTKRQARSAFEQSNISRSHDEGEWEDVYETCLQWLLIHLSEHQLPEGFDPRGRTLDVVLPSKRTSYSGDIRTPGAMTLVERYGILLADAERLDGLAVKQNRSIEEVLWHAVCRAAGVDLFDHAMEVRNHAQNEELLNEEIGALEAIFEAECSVDRSDESMTIEIGLTSYSLKLVVSIEVGLYPSRLPSWIALKGSWPVPDVGASCLAELAKAVSKMQLGEPMIFALHGHTLEVIQAAGELPMYSLSSVNNDDTEKSAISLKESAYPRHVVHLESLKPPSRKKELGVFWSIRPGEVPRAVDFPHPEPSIERSRKSLPAAAARDQFLDILKKASLGSRVVLVTGDTGCGKTTQIPQFILEDVPEAKIVVAQPRRLAATGVASRVAQERGESKPGFGTVGYVVRGESAVAKQTRLLFCTTGVLLRQLQNEGALRCISHVVVDEVHERNLDTDVLLALLRTYLPDNKHLSVVLMSATLDADRFATYWGGNTPKLHIPGHTFPVKDFWLEDVVPMVQYVPPRKKKQSGTYSSEPDRKEIDLLDSCSVHSDQSSRSNDDPMIEGVYSDELVNCIDETTINYDLLGRLVHHIIRNRDISNDGSILIFLPGAPEIERLSETIKRCTKDLPIFLLHLHGGMQPKDQSAVFRPAPDGTVKVVLSTNICETSVTIPDCTVVIDTAREKQSSYDPMNRIPLLVEKFCSQASLAQRRGRAGRVREGTCFKLISRATAKRLRKYTEPEIQRCALDQTLISLLHLGVESGSGTFLRTLLDPPSKDTVDAAIFCLSKLGAIELANDQSEVRLTPLGLHLAAIPAPPTVGKMLVMGSILGCRSASLSMAAGMSTGRSPFLRLNRPRSRPGFEASESVEEAKRQKIIDERAVLYREVGNSDHAVLAAVFAKWTDATDKRKYCDSVGLAYNGMKEMSQLVKQLDSSLATAGFENCPESDRNRRSWRIIRACAVSAMSPNQLVKVVRPMTTYHETAEGAKEREGEAKTLKFLIRTDRLKSCSGTDDFNKVQEEQVFIHPSSFNFETGSYSCPWLVYHSLVRTSKPFLRDLTECTAYALLLFGGELNVQASQGTIVVDGWAKLSANGRIGALVGGLRRKVDELLRRKVDQPSFDITNTKEMNLIAKLLMTDGHF